MKKVTVFLAVLFVILFVGDAKSYHTGNDIYTYIDGSLDYTDAYFTGYIVGYIRGTQPVFQFNIPDGVTNQQIIDVVLDYIKNNPDIRHQSIDLLIPAAVGKTFPPEQKP